jgi:hypothetical protein
MPDASIDWLLGADPAIGWQVRRDLLDAPASDRRAERAKVEVQGSPHAHPASRTPRSRAANASGWPA